MHASRLFPLTSNFGVRQEGEMHGISWHKRQAIVIGGITIQLPTFFPSPTGVLDPPGIGTLTIPVGATTTPGSSSDPRGSGSGAVPSLHPPTTFPTTNVMPPATPTSPSVVTVTSRLISTSLSVSTQTLTDTETKTEFVTTRTYATTSGTNVWTATTIQTLIGTNSSDQKAQGFSSNVGGIVGLIFGVLAFLGILAAFLFLYLTRRRKLSRQRMMEERRTSHAHLRGEGYEDGMPGVFKASGASPGYSYNQSGDEVNLVAGEAGGYGQSSSSLGHPTSAGSSHAHHSNPSFSSPTSAYAHMGHVHTRSPPPLPKLYRGDTEELTPTGRLSSDEGHHSSSNYSHVQFALHPIGLEPPFSESALKLPNTFQQRPKLSIFNRIRGSGSKSHTSSLSPTTESGYSSVLGRGRSRGSMKTPDLLFRNTSSRTAYTTTEESAPPVTPPLTRSLGWTWTDGSTVRDVPATRQRLPMGLLGPPKDDVPMINTSIAGPLSRNPKSLFLDNVPMFPHAPSRSDAQEGQIYISPPSPALLGLGEPSPDATEYRGAGLIDIDIGKQRLKSMLALHSQGSNASFSRDGDSLRDFVDYSRPALLGNIPRAFTTSSMTTAQLPKQSNTIDLTVDPDTG